MAVKAIVCLDASPDFEVAVDSVYVSDYVQITVRTPITEQLELSDNMTGTTNYRPVDTFEISEDRLGVLVQPEPVSLISLAGETISASIRLTVTDSILLTDSINYDVGSMLPFVNSPALLAESLTVSVATSVTDTASLAGDTLTYFTESTNLYDNTLFDTAPFN